MGCQNLKFTILLHWLKNCPQIKEIDENLLILDPYSVEFRYPGEKANTEDAKTAISALETCWLFFSKLLR